MPHLKNKAIVYAACTAIVAGIVLGGQQIESNHTSIDKQFKAQRHDDMALARAGAKQCHYNKVQNAILIAQLQLAESRARASLPPTKAGRRVKARQLAGIRRGIVALKSLKC